MNSATGTDPHSDPGPGVGGRIVQAGLAVGAAHLLFKLAGLILAIVMARFVTAGAYEAVYAVAFEACLFSVFLIGEEVIGPTFLPVFMRQMDRHGEPSAWRFANTVLTVQALLLLVVTALMVGLPAAIVRALTAWNAAERPGQFELAVDSLRAVAPGLICLSLGSTTYMILNGYKRFFLAALGDASWKFCVILAVAVGIGWAGLGPSMIVLGLVLGSAAKLLTHLCGLGRRVTRFRVRFDLRSPAVRTMIVLMLPLIAGILVAKARDIFNNVSVLSHLETVGLIQANSFGRKLYQPIGWLVPYSLSIAMFPFFCELVDFKANDKLGRLLTDSARMLLSLFIPLTLVCVVLARPITELLFRGGEFTQQNVGWTSVSMACYTLVLPAASIEYLLMQAFFANRRMVSVTVIGIVFSLLSMAISYLGVVVLGLGGAWALAAIAGGFAVSRMLKSTTLIVLLKRNVPCFEPAATLGFLARATLAGVAAAAACYAVREAFETVLPTPAARPMLIVELMAAGLAAAAVFVPACFLLRVHEPGQMLAWTLERVRERFRGKG